MKKLFFLLACVVGLMTFASCDPEVIDNIMAQKPTVEFVMEEGYIAGNTGVYVGTELKFKVKVAPNSSSQSPIAHANFSIVDISGNVIYDNNQTIEDPNNESTFVVSVTPTVASTYIVTASVTDEAGKANIAEVTVGYIQPIQAEIGVFEGMMNITGRVTTDAGILPGSEPLNEEINITDLATKLTLGTTVNNKIVAIIEIDGTPVELQATPTGNSFGFDNYEFNTSIELYGIAVAINVSVDMNGVLEGDDLILNGTSTGTGSVTVIAATVHVNLVDGVISGTLTKTA